MPPPRLAFFAYLQNSSGLNSARRIHQLPRRNYLKLLSAFCLLLFLTFSSLSQTVTQTSQTPKSPASGPAIQQEPLRSLKSKQPPVGSALSGGETHSYSVELNADEFISLIVGQDGIDVVVSLYAPDGSLLRSVDAPYGTKGEEWLSWIGEVKGTYRLEIHPLEKTAKPGNYKVKDVEIRAATPRDRKYVTADVTFQEGDTLNTAAKNGDSRQALAKYEASLPVWREIGEKLWEAWTLSRIGRIYYKLGEGPKAKKSYEEALPLFRTLGDRGAEIHALNYIGIINADFRNHDKALEFLRQALEVCRGYEPCDGEAGLLRNLAFSYQALGNWQKALDHYKEAEPLYVKAGQRDQVAITLDWIGALNRRMGKGPDAVEAFTRLVALRQELKDRKGEVVALRKLGQTYAELSEQRKALEFHERALTIAQADSDQAGISEQLFWMGVTYQRLNEHLKAVELLNQALPLASGDERIAVLTGLARSHRLIGNRQLALDAYKEALSLIPPPKSDVEELTRQKSEAEVQAPDIESEIKSQQELETLEAEALGRRTSGDRTGESAALNHIGDIQLKLREPSAALETFNRSLPLLKALGDREGEARALNKIGLIHLALQNKPKALDGLSQSLKISREIGDRREEQEILSTVHLVKSSLRKLPGSTQSQREFEAEANDAYLSVGDSKPVIVYQASLYLELWIGNHHLDALNLQNYLLKEALAARLEKRPDVSDRLKVLFAYFVSYVKEENWQEAIKKGNEILGLAPYDSNTRHKLGDVYFAMADHQRALDSYSQALKIRRELKDRKGEAETLVAMGITYNWLGDRVKALDLYQQALPYQRAAAAGNAEAQTLFRIAESHFLMGEKQKALDFLTQASAAVREKNEPTGAQISEYIGRVYASLGQRNREQEFYKLSLRESRRFLAIVLAGRKLDIGMWLAAGELQRHKDYVRWDKRRQGAALADAGEAYYRMGLKTDALATFNEALPILKEVGKVTHQAQVLLKLGILYHSNGDRVKALDALQQALNLRRADGDRGGQAEVLHALGTVYDSSGDKLKALEFYSEALTLRREIKDPEGEGETLDKLMLLWKSLDKSQLAIFYGKQAVNAFQRIRSNITGLDKELQKGFLTSRSDTYRQLADLLISNGRLPEAQQVLDILKQEEYRDFVRSESDSDPNTAATLNRNEAALLQRYAEIESQIIAFARKSSELRSKESLTPEEKKLLDKLEKDLEAANLAFDKFLLKLPSQFKDAGQGTAKALELRSAQALSETLRELGAGVVVLYTVATAEKYHVILITPETQVAREYAIKTADLNRKVQQFRTALQNPKYDPLPLAQDLYKILVGPVAKDLEAAKAETVMWSLDGTLRYLPIAALHDGKQYMVEKYRNTVFTPASQSRLERPPSAHWRGLGLGVSKSAVPLPFVIDELHGIIRDEANQTPTEGVLAGKIMVDDTFTKDGMKSELRKGFSLVHIASHFVFKPGNETDSYLLLGGLVTDKDEDKQLTLAEIKRAPNLFRGVELLTLSACNTGVGNGAAGAGAEVENFGVLAQLKGARAVIATLWRVNDKSTMRLMRTFYQLHNDQPSAPKAEALRQAQLALLRGQIMTAAGEQARGGDAATIDQLDEGLLPFKADPRAPYAHPYYWAPFILIGNWR